MFIDYPKRNDDGKSGFQLHDEIINHTDGWRTYVVLGSKSSTVHECSHKISSDIRIGRTSIEDKADFNIFEFKDGGIVIQPNELYGKINGFYLRNNKAFRVEEPNLRKSHAAPYIPSELRGSRYSTYITGQTAWDDTPLYIYDEWNAYILGTECAIELGEKGNTENRGTDICMGPLEFTAYSIGLCLAIKDKQPDYLTPTFLEFTQMQIKRSLEGAKRCNELFPWSSYQSYYDKFMRSSLAKFIKTTELTRKDFDLV